MKFKPGDKASLIHRPQQQVTIIEYFKDTEEFHHVSEEDKKAFHNHIIFFYLNDGEDINIDKRPEEEFTLS